MTESEFDEMCHRMLNPPKPTPLTYEQAMERYYQAIEQIKRSAGNMGSDSPAVPESLRGLENVGGGGEHCIIIPRPVRSAFPAG